LRVDVEVVDALDLGGVVARAGHGDPAPADGVAAPEDVERLEDERGLAGRASDERVSSGEGYGALLQQALVVVFTVGGQVGTGEGPTYRDASKLVDGVREILEIARQEGIGSRGEVARLRVGQQVVEGVDNGGSLEGEDAADNRGGLEMGRSLRWVENATGESALLDIGLHSHWGGDRTGGERQGDEGGRELHVDRWTVV